MYRDLGDSDEASDIDEVSDTHEVSDTVEASDTDDIDIDCVELPNNCDTRLLCW